MIEGRLVFDYFHSHSFLHILSDALDNLSKGALTEQLFHQIPARDSWGQDCGVEASNGCFAGLNTRMTWCTQPASNIATRNVCNR